MSEVKEKLVTLNLAVKDIVTNGNVRTTTNRNADLELADSIDQYGVIEPIVVRKDKNNYIVVAGHRRLNAVRAIKGKTIPARVLDINEDKATEMQVIENLQRQDLTPMEEAEAYKLLLEKNNKNLVWNHKGKKVLPSGEFNTSVKLVAKIVGKKFSHVLRTLRLVELPKQVIAWIKQGRLTALHGALLVDLPEKAQENVVEKCLKMQLRGLNPGDIFPVSTLKNYIDRTFARDLKSAPFITNEVWADTIACTDCPSNSGNAMGLFDGGGALGSCREAMCFNRKRDEVYKNIRVATAPRFAKLKLKFAGYARRTADDCNDRKGAIPKFIKGFMTLTDKQAKDLSSLITTKTSMFGWAIVKPLVDSKTPKVDIVHVCKDVNVLPAKLKKEVEGGDKKEGYDHERANFIREKVSNAMHAAKVDGIKKLKANTGYFLALAMGDYNGRRTQWKQAAKLLGWEISPVKGKHVLQALPLAKVATLAFAVAVLTDYDGPALLGLDTEKLTAEITKAASVEYAQLKSKEAKKQ